MGRVDIQQENTKAVKEVGQSDLAQHIVERRGTIRFFARFTASKSMFAFASALEWFLTYDFQ